MSGAYVLAQKLLDELTARLAETRAGAPCSAMVHPGDMVPAYSSNCSRGCEGLAAVRIVSTYPTVSFPEQLSGVAKPGCAIEDVVMLEMVVDRCYYTPKDNAQPTNGYLDSAARDAQEDAQAMRLAAAEAWDRKRRRAMGIWAPRGPAGGIHGGTLQVMVSASLSCGPGGEFPQIDSGVPPVLGDPRH